MNIRKIVKAVIPKKLFKKIEPLGHKGEAVVLNAVNGFPSRGLKVIGVTGTNGKTTTCFMIYNLLQSAGYKVGIMTTVAYGAGDELHPQGFHMTNVSVPNLLKRVKWMKARGVEWLVLETTSHALAQQRVWGMPYSIAVMTNVTHEHLDYHGTFERYRDAKRRLFKQTNKNKKGLRAGVVNADDLSSHLFTADIANPLTYGIQHGDLKARAVKLTPTSSSYKLKIDKDEYRLKVNLPGEFNIYNSLAAVGVGRLLGFSKEQIEEGIAATKQVAGRMEAIDEDQSFNVVIDYAVTPDALEQALKTLRRASKGRILLVFGATGDRDKLKRPVMGEVAAREADLIFLTDDETYTEDPELIRQEVYKGIASVGGEDKTEVIGDRKKAIQSAFKAAGRGDTVLLTGIGHQTTRNMGGTEEPWDERAIAHGLLKKL